jgi:hypothetical protein
MANPSSNELHWRPSQYYEQMAAIPAVSRNLKISLATVFVIWALGAAVGGYLAGHQAFGSPVGGSALILFDSAIMYVWSVRLINKTRKYMNELSHQNPLSEIEEFVRVNPRANLRKIFPKKEFGDLLKIVKVVYSKEDAENTVERRLFVHSLISGTAENRIATLLQLFPDQPPSQGHWFLEVLFQNLAPFPVGKDRLIASKPIYKNVLQTIESQPPSLTREPSIAAPISNLSPAPPFEL